MCLNTPHAHGHLLFKQCGCWTLKCQLPLHEIFCQHVKHIILVRVGYIYRYISQYISIKTNVYMFGRNLYKKRLRDTLVEVVLKLSL